MKFCFIDFSIQREREREREEFNKKKLPNHTKNQLKAARFFFCSWNIETEFLKLIGF